ILIEEYERIVPLEYYYFTKETGLMPYDRFAKYLHAFNKSRPKEPEKLPVSSHLDLIRKITPNYLPILYFVFSRRQCTEKAHELAENNNYLTQEQRAVVEKRFHERFGSEDSWSASTRMLRRTTARGISYHHAGLLPAQKGIVEELFQERFIQVLYCTETFSVGINYPVKSVCFDSVRKFDGRTFRTLENHEFFQISGRAGRRGIDEKGYSFILVDLKYAGRERLPQFNLNRLEPLISQFKLSYNTVLNLTANLTTEQIAIYFQKSFSAFHHYQALTALQTSLKETEEQLSGIRQYSCQYMDTHRCLIKFEPKQQELERLRQTFQALTPQRKRRVYGREMARKIKRLEGKLQHTPQTCTPAQLQECQALSHSYHQLEQTQRDLTHDLAELPAPRAFLEEYTYRLEHLQQLGYFRDGVLLPRGKCAAKIYVQEIFVTELIFSDIFPQLNDDQLNALISSIDYETRKYDYFLRATLLNWEPVREIAKYVQRICEPSAVRFEPRAAILTYAWSRGDSLEQVQQMCNLDEGDIISIFRRTIDLLRQMRDAVVDPAFKARLWTCMNKLDRAEASIMDL
ncbi:MAG: helicase, partial [Peptococcaceae bacterium]|nr:helicase [Peptococcaceae bacterium]